MQGSSHSPPALWPFSIGFYDPKRKVILSFGNSRACGCNHNKISVHAEQLAIEYCRKYDKRHKFKIFIGRYAKDGHLKPAYCCHACSQLVKKYNFQDRVFTLDNDKFVSALKDNPSISIGYQIKHNTFI
jgi:hypothetical protein